MAGVVSKLPAHLQLRVLSMLDDKNFAAATGIGSTDDAESAGSDRTYVQETSQRFDAKVGLDTVREKGFIVFDSFLGSEASRGVLQEARSLFNSGRLRKAGMGRGDSAWADTRARGDDIVWLNELFSGAWAGGADASSPPSSPLRPQPRPPPFSPSSPADPVPSPKSSTSPARRLSIENLLRQSRSFESPPPTANDDDDKALPLKGRSADGGLEEGGKWIRALSVALDGVKQQIVEAAAGTVELRKATFQLARYAEGARYAKHRDVSAKCPDRRLTCIYYFNDGWREACGGELRLHLESGPVDVAPLPDRLILFLPDIEHEVLPSHMERFALSGWMYGPAPLCSEAAASLPSSEETQTPPDVHQNPTAYSGSRRRAMDKALSIQTVDYDLDEIFVSVVAYRDPEAQITLRELFRTAAVPERVYVGLVSQADNEEDADCFRESVPKQFSGNVAEVRVHYSEARGPCWARYLAQKLLGKQKYYLQIDSHTRFVRGWDRLLIQQLHMCASPKPVLSTYPPGYDRDAPVPEVGPPTALCATDFGPEGMLRIAGKVLRSKPTSPPQSLFWAAGFSFSEAKLIKDVPYDPSLKFLFFGEEMTMLARMWTKGYDVYMPTTSIVFHLWTRDYRRTFSQDIVDVHKLQSRSLARARWILGDAPPASDETAHAPTRLDADKDQPASSSSSSSSSAAAAAASSSSSSSAAAAAAAAVTHAQPAMHLNTCALLPLLSARKPLRDDPAEAASDPISGAGVGEEYGLGGERTLAAFCEHIGVDFASKVVRARARLGGMPEGSLL